MIPKAVDIRGLDFTGYGTYYNGDRGPGTGLQTLGEESRTIWTRTPLTIRQTSGIYRGHGRPHVLKAMEKHDYTQEVRCSAPSTSVILAWQKVRGMSRPGRRCGLIPNWDGCPGPEYLA